MNNVGMSLAVLIFSAWGVGEGCGCQSFSIPPDATKIGTLDLYIVGTKVESLPAPSTSSAAPRLIALTAYENGPYSFSMNFEVESEADVEFVYLGFGANGIYKAKVHPERLLAEGGGDTPITACGIAATNQGITCTAACLSACSCLVCPDRMVELNGEQSCAFNCTVYKNQGALAAAPWYGSEKTFASRLYKGGDGVPGFAAQLGCSASTCVSAPVPGAKRKKSVSIDFSTPINLSTTTLSTSMLETAPTTSNPVYRSEPGAAATVSISKCPPHAICTIRDR